MKRHLISAAFVLAFGLPQAQAKKSPAPKEPTLVWESKEVESPESAYFDPTSELLLVSNIVGSPVEKDQNGYLSAFKLDGTLVKKDWLSGLNAPKGMRSHKGTLWVSDIDEVVAINIHDKKIVKRIPIPGSKFLNDVAVTSKGAVYVSDMADGKIYEIKGDKVQVFAESKDLPNGLLIKNGKLIMAAWGEEMAQDFTTKVPGKVYVYDLKSKKRKVITSSPVGNLDGLEATKKGYIVSDWVSGDVYLISKSGKAKKVFTLPKGSADIAYLPKRKLLIVPQMLENKLSAYKLP